MSEIRNRADIPVEDTWATEDMYVNDAAWEAELATLEQDKEVLAGFAGKLGESGKNLYDYLYRSEMTDVKALRDIWRGIVDYHHLSLADFISAKISSLVQHITQNRNAVRIG